MARLKVASLFCGCGGMDLGIVGGFTFLNTEYPRSAFDIVYAVDNDNYCTKIYNANFDHKCIVKDVREIVPENIPDFEVLTGGALSVGSLVNLFLYLLRTPLDLVIKMNEVCFSLRW